MTEGKPYHFTKKTLKFKRTKSNVDHFNDLENAFCHQEAATVKVFLRKKNVGEFDCFASPFDMASSPNLSLKLHLSRIPLKKRHLDCQHNVLIEMADLM